jgi:ubiquinone/menaquinone biosynthesis C-methylase UbiE
MTNFYNRQILPHIMDFVCGLPVCEGARQDVVAQASGRVLEIGIGTGRNLPFYSRDKVSFLCGIDPAVHPHARERAQVTGIDISLRALSAEHIPAEDASFDCVISTFTLCTIPDTAAALQEVRRVLVPGGKFLFLEHGVAPDASVRSWQNKLSPVWGMVAGGCCLNKDVTALIKEAGFSFGSLDTGYKPGPRVLTYFYSGVAMVPGIAT